MKLAHSISAVVLSCLLAVPAAMAADDGNQLQLDPVRTQQAEIRAGAQAATGIYENLSSSQRDELLSRQQRVLRMIEGKQMSSELSKAHKLELFNELEWIEATVNRAQDQRMVCERRAVVGSNMKQRVCMTVAEKRAAEERARNEMVRANRETKIGG